MYKMDTDSISFVAQTSTLHNHIVEQSIISTVVDELQKIPDLKNLKMTLDLLLHIALIIENLTYDNKLIGRPKGYKVDMVVKIFEKLGLINHTEDKQFIVNGLNFLHSAGKIKRLGFFRRLWSKIYKFLRKNLIG